jgi:hypothetical protein
VTALLAFVGMVGKWEGSSAELGERLALRLDGDRLPKGWPSTPKMDADRVRRHATASRSRGSM